MSLDKPTKLRINNWCKKFSQIANNLEWRKNRNLHAINLLNMLINKRIDEPYNKKPDEEPLSLLSKAIIKSKLTKKFWKITEHIYYPKTINNTIHEEENLKKHNIKIVKNKTKINNKKENNIVKNIYNNKNDIKLKNKRVKTPSIKHKNLINHENNKNNNFYYNNKDNFNKENVYENKLNLLKENAIKLEEEFEQNKKIIEYQKKENVQLKQRIEKLTIVLKSIIPNNKI